VKKSFYKKNSFYTDIYVKPISRFIEVVKTFWRSKVNWLSGKHSKKYYLDSDFKKWACSCVPEFSSVTPIVTWIGQATFLIQVGGVNILTDPIFSDLMYFYPRNFAPGIALSDLPKIDFILISHNHQDHMEKKALLKLRKDNPTILIPRGNKKWFDKNGFENVIEKDWWEAQDFEQIKLTFLPAVHWSGNNPFRVNKSLWGSWMIESAEFKTYFAGDSAYAKHFSEIGNKFNSIDLALMPIAPCEPRDLVKNSHINTQEAVQAFLDLKAKSFVPMHWGTFRIGADKFDEPIKNLKKHWLEKEEFLKNQKLHVVKFGEQIKF